MVLVQLTAWSLPILDDPGLNLTSAIFIDHLYFYCKLFVEKTKHKQKQRPEMANLKLCKHRNQFYLFISMVNFFPGTFLGNAPKLTEAVVLPAASVGKQLQTLLQSGFLFFLCLQRSYLVGLRWSNKRVSLKSL